jgi:hypothetical protein
MDLNLIFKDSLVPAHSHGLPIACALDSVGQSHRDPIPWQ